jgi:hypothetical protein
MVLVELLTIIGYFLLFFLFENVMKRALDDLFLLYIISLLTEFVGKTFFFLSCVEIKSPFRGFSCSAVSFVSHH